MYEWKHFHVYEIIVKSYTINVCVIFKNWCRHGTQHISNNNSVAVQQQQQQQQHKKKLIRWSRCVSFWCKHKYFCFHISIKFNSLRSIQPTYGSQREWIHYQNSWCILYLVWLLFEIKWRKGFNISLHIIDIYLYVLV